MNRSLAALGLVAIIGVTGVACSDDDDESSGNLAEWCNLGSEINGLLEAGESIPDSTFSDFADAAPTAIRAASETASTAFKASPEAAFEDPSVQTAVQDIETYSESNCQ